MSTHVGAAFADSGATTAASAVFATPAGVAAGDLLIAGLEVQGGTNATITPPGGWTLITEQNATTATKHATYYRVATAGEPATHTFTLDAARKFAGGLIARRSVDLNQPIGLSAATGTANAPTLTPTASAVYIALWAPRTTSGSLDGTITEPGTMTERVDHGAPASATPWFGYAIADEDRPTNGATGTRTATTTVPSTTWLSQALVVYDPIYQAPAADSITNTDDATVTVTPAAGGGGGAGAADDTLTTADAAAVTVTGARTASDTLGQAQAAAITVAGARAASDTLGQAQAATVRLTIGRTAADTLTQTQTAVRGPVASSRTAPDTLTLAASAAARIAVSRAAGDTLTQADSATVTLGHAAPATGRPGSIRPHRAGHFAGSPAGHFGTM